MELNLKQVQLARDLIRLCNKHQVTLQASTGELSIGGMAINKVNTDECHVLNPDPKLKGKVITINTMS